MVWLAIQAALEVARAASDSPDLENGIGEKSKLSVHSLKSPRARRLVTQTALLAPNHDC
jgi:hypothetical protein